MKLKIAIIDPFFDVSHAYWAAELQSNSSHEIIFYTLPPKYWKWQMVGGTYELAQKIKADVSKYDLLLVTDMLDLPCFLGYLTGNTIPPVILYFHENQITYPWSDDDADIKKERDYHYSVMNLRSAIMANCVVFNSNYHKDSFLSALPDFVKMFPDKLWQKEHLKIGAKSSVLPIPIGLRPFMNKTSKVSDRPVFLWNHRWEYDKGPDSFFMTLFDLKKSGLDFGLIVLGRAYDKQPLIFSKAKEELSGEIIHWGYAESKNEYLELLYQANIIMVTGYQDFFGISVVEAIAAGCFPVLPNRLAYPEHISEKCRDMCLYEEGDLITRIKNVIKEKKYTKTIDCRDFVKKYEARKVVNEYDELFDSVALKHKEGHHNIR